MWPRSSPSRRARVPFIPPRGYWQSVREACDANGTLLIFDEIPTGLGKTGRFFAAEHDGVAPDIVVLGKALGGGVLPIAACVARADLDVAGEYAFGHYTHEKNPVTAAAALATLQVIEREALVEERGSGRRACAAPPARDAASACADRRRTRPRHADRHRTRARP
jgi:acetylornithine/succinyldiaminopimelate/putrescine aminotransferase